MSIARKPNPVDDLTHVENLAQLKVAIRDAIHASMVRRQETELTRHELSRRYDICWKIAERLRYDLGWGMVRITDHLPRYLHYELEGVSWEPDGRTCWVPSDGV